MASSNIEKIAVVTGASSGIGAATALALASKGYQVIGLARRVDKVIELAKKAENGIIHARECDVSIEEQVVSAFEWINNKFGGVDVLINNAGFSTFGGAFSGKYGDWKTLINVNVLAVSLCTKEAVKTMRTRGDNGVIIIISSIAGLSVPSIYDMGMYSVSKHAVTALTKSISNDLAKENSNIRVTNISPGAVFTEMVVKNRVEKQGLKYDPAVLEGPLPKKSLHPQDIADAILYVLSTPSRVQIPELTIQPVGQPKL